jgi:hypothetical protein
LIIGDLPPAVAAAFRPRNKDRTAGRHSASRLSFCRVSRAAALDRDPADLGSDRIVAKSVSAVYQEQRSCLPITLPENRA